MVTTHHDYETHPATGAEVTERERRSIAGTVRGGTTAGAIAGGGAVVLAILGLFDVLPFYMVTIATIAAGAALLIEGVSLAGAQAKLAREAHDGDRKRQIGVGGGLSAQAVGGAAAIVLGIIALFGVMPLTLVASAAIIMGASMLLGGAAHGDTTLDALETSGTSYRNLRSTEQQVKGASAAMALIGIGAATLGILVLIDVGGPLTLSLIAMLAIGAAALLAGSAMLSRIGTLVHR